MPRKPKQLDVHTLTQNEASDQQQTDKSSKDELIKMITETLTTIDKLKIDIKSQCELLKMQQNDLKYYLNTLCE
jgi:hypothetical protein